MSARVKWRILLVALAAAGVFPVTPLRASGRPPPDAPPAEPAVPPPVTLRKFAHEHGFTRLDIAQKTITLQGRQHTLVLEKDSRKAVLNGSILWLNQPVSLHKRQWSLAPVDASLSLGPLLRPASAVRNKGHRVVVLDPGHGGMDAGALSPSGLHEKAVVLDVSLRVRAYLVSLGHTVYLTRHQDQALSLEERPRRARAWKADVFVSLHANGGSATARGVETYALSLPGQLSTNQTPNGLVDPLSHTGNAHNGANVLLAHLIHKELVVGGARVDRGLRRARFAVLREAPAPAALVEMGFLSNPGEGAKLATVAERDDLAKAIARGIDAYVREVRKAALSDALLGTP